VQRRGCLQIKMMRMMKKNERVHDCSGTLMQLMNEIRLLWKEMYMRMVWFPTPEEMSVDALPSLERMGNYQYLKKWN